MEYWKNYRESTPVEKAPVTIRKQPKEDKWHTKTPQFSLRSSYRYMSVSQVQSIPNISIREEKVWGFFGHSTINHDYKSKTINGDRVVIDYATGLIWHQSGSSNYMKWEEVRQWVKDLNRRGYAGYSDWRLPTVEEAASLLESSEMNGDLYIDKAFGKEQRYVWTGDSYSSELTWRVGFSSGHVGWRGSFYGCVRPVRAMK